MRAYLFQISPTNPDVKLNKFEVLNLGQLEVKWCNYFGDLGVLKIGPFKTTIDQNILVEIEIQEVNKEDLSLKLEEPKSVAFRLYSFCPSPMKLMIGVKEQELKNLLIYGVSNNNLGQLTKG